MNAWIKSGLVAASCLGLGAASAPGQQVIEREARVTGPRGRSIERDVRSVRGPGYLQRDVRIQRPGGTFQRDARVLGPRAGGFAPRPGPLPLSMGYRPGPRTFIERDVIINNRGGGPGWGTVAGVGGGLFGLGMLAGNLLASPAPPPPPVVYALPPVVYAQPAPVVVASEPAPPPNVVYNPPQRYNPQQAIVIDPVADAIGRLESQHANSRRDGARTLGQLGDPRAIPALVERLKYDDYRGVRIAAAEALGEIGDPQASIYLERASIYDKKQDVRNAALDALARLPRVQQAGHASPAQTSPASGAGGPAVAPTSPVPDELPPPLPQPPQH